MPKYHEAVFWELEGVWESLDGVFDIYLLLMKGKYGLFRE